MGAPKQKWTPEEEAALKCGVAKHGPGKWRTILRDPEFSGVLQLRSNVDLKDKWRNMSMTANGVGSRVKARLALKKSRRVPKHDDTPMAVSTELHTDTEVVDSEPLAVSGEHLQIAGQKKSIARLDNLILEAIRTLKEPAGSNKTAIAMRIEDQFWPPPDFQRLLSEKLKALATSGKLIEVNRKYRIAPGSAFSEGRNSKVLSLEGRQRGPSKLEGDDAHRRAKHQLGDELARMSKMTAPEAAAYAAQAVAEAETAIADAEDAARVAEAAEADAEAAQAFVEAAMSMLKNRNAANLMLRA